MASVIAMCGSVCKTWGSAKNGMTMQGGVSKCLKLQFFVIVRINVIKNICKALACYFCLSVDVEPVLFFCGEAELTVFPDMLQMTC